MAEAMGTATARRLRALVLDRKSRARLDSNTGGGFFDRYPIRAIKRIRGGYQWGYEICGYGTVLGYCENHEHKTRERAARCGARYEAGIPSWMVWRADRG